MTNGIPAAARASDVCASAASRDAPVIPVSVHFVVSGQLQCRWQWCPGLEKLKKRASLKLRWHLDPVPGLAQRQGPEFILHSTMR